MKSKKKLKIISVSGIKDFVGGAETFNLELCNSLRDRGHKVFNLFATTNLIESKNLSSNDYFYKLGKINIFDINIGGIFSLFVELKKISKTVNPDIIYLHLYLPPLALMLFSSFFSLPKIVHTYGVWYKEFESSNSENVGNFNKLTLFKYNLGVCFRRLAQRLMLSKANGVIALSNFHAEQIYHLFGKNNKGKVAIIGGGVSGDDFYPVKKSKMQLKKELGFSNKKIITIVSRIEPRKGILQAIESMPEVITHSDSILLIISPHYDGTFLNYLSSCYEAVSKHNLGGRVLFKTGLTKSSLRPYYQMSDCFLMPSTSLETFGLTTIEAMRCGTVVVGVDSGNTGEILREVNSPLLVNSSNPRLIAKKIIECFEMSSSKKNNLVAEGLNLAKQFNWRARSIELERYFYHVKSQYDSLR